MPTQKLKKYKRILLKLSGEQLIGDEGFGIDPKVLDKMALEIGQLVGIGVQVGLVIGGGNLFRGAALNSAGMDRVTGDHMGMLATVMNALAMRDALERTSISSRVMSAIQMSGVVEHYDRRRAMRYLQDGDVVIFAAGTGNPFFTTDTAACLRAIETQSQIMLKATRVDGVYSEDPEKNDNAIFYEQITFNKAIGENLKVMDATALTLARDHSLPIKVFNINTKDSLKSIILGEKIGTLINESD
jgi:uridylate kinase